MLCAATIVVLFIAIAVLLRVRDREAITNATKKLKEATDRLKQALANTKQP
jgi:hypothetical protein